jgi:hypothetical protein
LPLVVDLEELAAAAAVAAACWRALTLKKFDMMKQQSIVLLSRWE